MEQNDHSYMHDPRLSPMVGFGKTYHKLELQYKPLTLKGARFFTIHASVR